VKRHLDSGLAREDSILVDRFLDHPFTLVRCCARLQAGLGGWTACAQYQHQREQLGAAAHGAQQKAATAMHVLMHR
jgi:hypothetical protein